MFFTLFLSSIIIGTVLEVCYRSYELGKFVLPKLWNIQIYVWVSFILYFLHISDLNFVCRLVIILVATTGIEYITGYLYLKNKRKKLWDYSKEKYNYKGIICLKFSFYWLMLSLFYLYLVLPVLIY